MATDASDSKATGSAYDFEVKDCNGAAAPLSAFRGQVSLIVNVASQCGLTQCEYEALAHLHKTFGAKGFNVLAFPCNQFGAQEPAPAAEVKTWAAEKYGVSFPVFEKVEVNPSTQGEAVHPLFAYLKQALPGPQLGGAVKWNFTKWLVDQDGRPVKRYEPRTSALEAEPEIVELLGKKAAASNAYSFEVKDCNGAAAPLSAFRGQVSLIVNVASQCGLTQCEYEALANLHKSYAAKGFNVLAFPCNQFGAQEPAPAAEVKTWAAEKYGVSFPVFEKVEVNPSTEGEAVHPLFAYLKQELPGPQLGGAVKWNFTKWLVDHEGNPVKRYEPRTSAMEAEPDIVELLAKKDAAVAATA